MKISARGRDKKNTEDTRFLLGINVSKYVINVVYHAQLEFISFHFLNLRSRRIITIKIYNNYHVLRSTTDIIFARIVYAGCAL